MFASWFHDFHAGNIDISYNLPCNFKTFDGLVFNIYDEKNRNCGIFSLDVGIEQERYEFCRGWPDNYVYIYDSDYIKYVDKGKFGSLYVKEHGYSREYVCDITDEQWEQIIQFVSKWKYRDRFIREQK